MGLDEDRIQDFLKSRDERAQKAQEKSPGKRFSKEDFFLHLIWWGGCALFAILVYGFFTGRLFTDYPPSDIDRLPPTWNP